MIFNLGDSLGHVFFRALALVSIYSIALHTGWDFCRLAGISAELCGLRTPDPTSHEETEQMLQDRQSRKRAAIESHGSGKVFQHLPVSLADCPFSSVDMCVGNIRGSPV